MEARIPTIDPSLSTVSRRYRSARMPVGKDVRTWVIPMIAAKIPTYMGSLPFKKYTNVGSTDWFHRDRPANIKKE